MVYKSLLLGYNTTALQELEKYVISGSFDPEALGEDEVILSVARTDDTKENDTPGNYREGTPLMDYQAGDEITIKYREDRKTSSKEYERFQDAEEPYVYKRTGLQPLYPSRICMTAPRLSIGIDYGR